jgi:hypothetical protein
MLYCAAGRLKDQQARLLAHGSGTLSNEFGRQIVVVGFEPE